MRTIGQGRTKINSYPYTLQNQLRGAETLGSIRSIAAGFSVHHVSLPEAPTHILVQLSADLRSNIG